MYDDLAHRQKLKEGKTRVPGLINFLASNFQFIRQKIPWCKRKDEKDLDDLSVKELMQMMDKENLNHISINKLLIMRKFIAWLMFTTFCHQCQYTINLFQDEEINNTKIIINITYWALWLINLILMFLTELKNQTQLIYI